MKQRVLGISRSPKFSPNSEERDEAIFNAVVANLRNEGLDVATCSEDSFDGVEGLAAVFSMAREEKVLRQLAEAEEKGLSVVNSAKALLRGSRIRMMQDFEEENIPIASSPVVFIDGEMKPGPSSVCGKRVFRKEALEYPCWLKRSEACAQSATDVCFVENAEALELALQGYQARGIREILLCEHLEGDLVKFYGVEATGFFYVYYPTAGPSFSKFGLESINGAPQGFPLDVERLKQTADRAARLCGMEVYGGDCVVAKDGSFRIIDFNDWPSFSHCREEAAKAIAEKILSRINP